MHMLEVALRPFRRCEDPEAQQRAKTQQMIDDASVVDDRFKDKSLAIHQILIDTYSDACKTEAKIEKRITTVQTYLNSLHLMYPVFKVEQGNWLVGVKGDRELPPSSRFNHWSKGCYSQVIRAAVAEKEEWVVVKDKEEPDVPACSAVAKEP